MTENATKRETIEEFLKRGGKITNCPIRFAKGIPLQHTRKTKKHRTLRRKGKRS